MKETKKALVDIIEDGFNTKNKCSALAEQLFVIVDCQKAPKASRRKCRNISDSLSSCIYRSITEQLNPGESFDDDEMSDIQSALAGEAFLRKDEEAFVQPRIEDVVEEFLTNQFAENDEKHNDLSTLDLEAIYVFHYEWNMEGFVDTDEDTPDFYQLSDLVIKQLSSGFSKG